MILVLLATLAQFLGVKEMSYTISKGGKDHTVDSIIIDATYEGISEAETGIYKDLQGPWIRAMSGRSTRQGTGGSVAFGPLQINSFRVKESLNNHKRLNLTSEEIDFLENHLIPLQQAFATHGNQSKYGKTYMKDGVEYIPFSVWSKDMLSLGFKDSKGNTISYNSNLANVDIPYNSVYDYGYNEGAGVGDEVLVSFYKDRGYKGSQIDSLISKFKKNYTTTVKKSIADVYFLQNKLALQMGYKSAKDHRVNPAGEIATTITGWRFGPEETRESYNRDMTNYKKQREFKLYYDKALDTTLDYLNTNSPGNKKYFREENPRYLDQIYYKNSQGKKVFVENKEAVDDLIFGELDFTT